MRLRDPFHPWVQHRGIAADNHRYGAGARRLGDHLGDMIHRLLDAHVVEIDVAVVDDRHRFERLDQRLDIRRRDRVERAHRIRSPTGVAAAAAHVARHADDRNVDIPGNEVFRVDGHERATEGRDPRLREQVAMHAERPGLALEVAEQFRRRDTHPAEVSRGEVQGDGAHVALRVVAHLRVERHQVVDEAAEAGRIAGRKLMFELAFRDVLDDRARVDEGLLLSIQFGGYIPLAECTVHWREQERANKNQRRHSRRDTRKVHLVLMDVTVGSLSGRL